MLGRHYGYRAGGSEAAERKNEDGNDCDVHVGKSVGVMIKKDKGWKRVSNNNRYD